MAVGGGPKGEVPGSGPIVSLDGDLDIVTSEDVKRQIATLVEIGNSTVTIDMGAVDFVDSSGLGALVAVHQLAVARGSHLVVRSVPSRVRQLLALTRLDDLLSVEN
jgi:anti-sigma B factor antagonist